MRRRWIAPASALVALALVGWAFADTRPLVLSIAYSTNINGEVMPCPT